MRSTRDRRGSGGGGSAGSDVVLIGYQDQGNLGMGYLASTLRVNARTVQLIEIRDAPDSIVSRVHDASPHVVGFSLIFQSFLPQFRTLARLLRDSGVGAHFTIGGHYPSLCPDEVLRQMPQLDSVSLYEGESTLLELVDALTAEDDWRSVPGLVFRGDGQAETMRSDPRPLVQDLDSLPWPWRPFEPERILGFVAQPLLASRGCARQCSFCSIHRFYRSAPGKVVRVRSPHAVIDEMAALHHDFGTRVFLFQDDDFPLWGRAGEKRMRELAEGLHESGLADRVLWKISCRAEYVDANLFAPLRDAGLFMVYMGIESGVDEGLEVLNKNITPKQSIDAVQTLKALGVMYSYGFMLFDPSSTFASVRQNVGFLRRIVGDGSVAALFCRMLPYTGTPIRDQLEREGRLHGDVTHPDYDFVDPRLNDYHRRLDPVVAPWVHNDGVSHQLNWAWDELGVAARFIPSLEGLDQYRDQLRRLTAASNEHLLRTVENSSRKFEEDGLMGVSEQQARQATQQTRTQLLSLRNSFVARNVDRVMAEIDRQTVGGPITAPQMH